LQRKREILDEGDSGRKEGRKEEGKKKELMSLTWFDPFLNAWVG
jgi:hypothetical protein